MKLLFKQRFFSWFDSYDIYDEAGNTLFAVKGELAWVHLIRIYDASGNEVGYIKEKMLTWLPQVRDVYWRPLCRLYQQRVYVFQTEIQY